MTTATATVTRATDLEPSLAFRGTYVTRRRVTYIDGAVLLSAMLVLISMIPARLVVPSMTDLGRPGLIVGFLLFCWWVLVRFSSHLVMTGPIEMPRDEDGLIDVTAATAVMTKIVEGWVREHPEQWFWLHDRWK